MKILAFTDTHGNDHLINEVIKKAKTKHPELLVCCGDVTIFGDSLNKILSKLNEVNIPVLLIPGNHEEGIDLKKICKRYKNIVYLHKALFEVNDYVFFGHGGDGFSQKNLEFEKISKLIENKIKNKKIILVTHQPPYKNKSDFLEYFGHVGSISYRNFIIKYKPILSLSGHLHEDFGSIDRIGKTVVINPGPLGRIIEI